MDLYEKYMAMREEIDTNALVEKNMTAVTVRLPKSIIGKIDFIKEEVGQSRQSVLLDLIDEAANAAFQGCLKGGGYSVDQAMEIHRRIGGYGLAHHPDQVSYLQDLVTRGLVPQIVVDDWLTCNYTKLELAEKHDLDKSQIYAIGYADDEVWNDYEKGHIPNEVLTDWKTGNYTKLDLAKKHNLNKKQISLLEHWGA